MLRIRSLSKPAIRSFVVLLVVLAGGFLTGNSWRQPSVAHAEVRRKPPREAFQSGGARSEVVLREIAATLKRIESRMERIERVVTKKSKE
jgi:hypothetical protein